MENDRNPDTFEERKQFWKRFQNTPATLLLGNAILAWYKENDGGNIHSTTEIDCTKSEASIQNSKAFHSFQKVISSHLKE